MVQLLAANSEKPFFDQTDLADKLKEAAFREMFAAAKGLTEQQRRKREEAFFPQLQKFNRREAEGTEIPPDWQLKVEFWRKEVEIFNELNQEQAEKKAELLDFETAVKTLKDGPAKSYVLARKVQLEKAQEPPKLSEVVDSIKSDRERIKQIYENGGFLSSPRFAQGVRERLERKPQP
ncbi:MAG: hypothetical protein V1664_02795 [Candidatus Uhrbacteria bacterium]